MGGRSETSGEALFEVSGSRFCGHGSPSRSLRSNDVSRGRDFVSYRPYRVSALARILCGSLRGRQDPGGQRATHVVTVIEKMSAEDARPYGKIDVKTTASYCIITI
jgi:hypothetical protein